MLLGRWLLSTSPKKSRRRISLKFLQSALTWSLFIHSLANISHCSVLNLFLLDLSHGVPGTKSEKQTSRSNAKKTQSHRAVHVASLCDCRSLQPLTLALLSLSSTGFIAFACAIWPNSRAEALLSKIWLLRL